MSGSEDDFRQSDIFIQTGDTAEETESDSIQSASKASEVSSSANGSSGHRGRSKKRRVKEDATSSPRRTKRTYRNRYRELFNETLKETVSKKDVYDSSLVSSQIGVTIWLAEEKDLFFSSLSRRGRHDIRSIAADVSSKSEVEVHVYMENLQAAARNEQIYGMAPRKFLKNHEIDAAFEISERCCTSLDLAAEALLMSEQNKERKLEKKELGDLSLLTPKTAKWADRCLQAGERGEDEVARTLPSARLLDLNTFLKLSARLFMNSSVIDNNWRSHAKRGMRPSMMYTALSDFHNLIISLTKRLVQSCLFFAMSRLRALDTSGNYTSGRNVRRGDVITALNTLGMELKGTRTWAGLARKCRLRVYDDIGHSQRSRKRYSYDEVEEILSSEQARPRGRSVTSRKSITSNSASNQSASSETSSAEETEEPELSTHHFSDDDQSSSSSSSENSSVSHGNKQARRRELLEKSQDDYAEALDKRASQDEERRLWMLLGETPDKNKVTEKLKLPKMPPVERKDKDELVDWRGWVNYVGEWEKFESPVPASSFAENRRTMQNISSATGLTESDTETDDVGRGKSPRRRSTRRKSTSEKFVHDESPSEQEQSMSGIESDSEDEDGDEDEDIVDEEVEMGSVEEEEQEEEEEESSPPSPVAMEGVSKNEVEDSGIASQEEDVINNKQRSGRLADTDEEQLNQDISMHSAENEESEDSEAI